MKLKRSQRGFTVIAECDGRDVERFEIIMPTEDDALNQAGNLYLRLHPDWNMFENKVTFRIDYA